MRHVLLYYRIPARLRIPNPSPRLCRRGVRVDGSVWVIEESQVPWALLDELNQAGAVADVVPFDPAARDTLRALCKLAIQEQAGQITERMGKALAKAKTMLDQTTAMVVTDDQNKRHDRYVKAILRRARKQIAYAEEAAMAFELLGEVAQATESVKCSIAAAVDAFVLLVSSREKPACTGHPVATPEPACTCYPVATQDGVFHHIDCGKVVPSERA